MIPYWINKLTDLFYLIIIGFSILVSFFGIYYTFTYHDDLILKIGSSFFLLFGLMFILKHSKLIYESKYMRIIYLLLCIQIIGVIFKIQHYPGSKIFFMINSFGLIVLYLYRYIKKENKSVLDSIKLIWVLIFFTSIIPMNVTITFCNNLNVIGLIIFIYMFVHIIIENKILLKR